MARVTLRDPEETKLEVELEGRVFAVAAMTRSRQAVVDDALAKLDGSTTTDEAAAAITGVIDAMVAPTGGQKKTAGAILLGLWEADKISISQLSQLLEDLQEAASERPT